MAIIEVEIILIATVYANPALGELVYTRQLPVLEFAVKRLELDLAIERAHDGILICRRHIVLA